MKKIFFIILVLIGFLGLTSSVVAQDTPKIYFFYGTGCPHCAQVEKYFEDEDLYNRYQIDSREIYSNHDNALLYNSLMDGLGIPSASRGVPTVIIGDSVLIGDTPIIQNFIPEADKLLAETPVATLKPDNQDIPKKEESPKSNLTLAAVIAGALVDAINPCEFAVLIILMTTILASGNAKKALKAGLAFSLSIFISYLLMGLGLYKALSLGKAAGGFLKIIGFLAIILGVLNLKDYFWYGKGFLMEVPLAWRPKLKELIHSVTSPLGAFFIGFLVSIFLLPCTSGPYIIILGMMAKKVINARAFAYLLLYNLIFVSPMVLISLAVYGGFDPAKAEEIRQKRLRILHLIAGVVMIAMGVVILVGWI
jgi:cytochrome c biogenesis protein CcdA/glutaredoxin